MCDVCCKEFKGWCRAFTKAERALTIVEALLLAVLIFFLIFLILHLLACPTVTPYSNDKEYVFIETSEYSTVESEFEEIVKSTKASPMKIIENPTSVNIETITIDPELECSWTPSAKTTALTHFYERSVTKTNTKIISTQTKLAVKPSIEDILQSDRSNGEDEETIQNKYVLALVKLRPPQDVVFGCILTVISDYWLLTAASCIEAIEEVDSLDSFVIMEEYGTSSNGKIRSILDLQIHPFYQGSNKSYDLAALKSESGLGHVQAVVLPTMLDYFITTIGERFHVLGFGAYRGVDRSERGRSLRRVRVFRLSRAECGGAEAEARGWGLRHLAAGRPLPAAPCEPARPLCAGGLVARALPCNYCSGAPLLRGALLLAVMAHNPHCGAACEPQLYVNVASLRDWVDTLVGG